MKELAKELGVKNIIVSHINDMKYKDHITVVINDDLAMELVGKTLGFVPLTDKGIGKGIPMKDATIILNAIKKKFE